MWAKGPMPGYSSEKDAQKFIPGAVCKKKHAMCDIVGYVIYPSAADALADTNPISSAGSAQNAWEKALLKFARYNVVTNEWEKLADSV